jgi:DNA polymerase III subunit alpha
MDKRFNKFYNIKNIYLIVEVKMFCQLHLHTHLGSRLDGIASPEDYAQKAMKLNHPAIAITDHGRLSAIWEHQQTCLKYSIKPIIGVEMYLNDNLEEYDAKEKRIRGKNNHIIILVKNKDGYKNLLKLNYLSMKDATHFYYVPRITTKELFLHKEGLIIGTGCMANPFASLLRNKEEEKAEKLFNLYCKVFKDNFYTEVQLNEITGENGELKNGQKTINDFMIYLANKNGVPIVVTGDVHYLDKGHDKLQTLAIAIRDKATIDNLQFELESKELYYHDIEDYVNFNEKFNYNYSKNDIIEWCNNTTFIADKTNFLIPNREKLYLPKVSENDDSLLIKEAKEGLQKRFNLEKIPKNYQRRLAYELEIIIRKGFSSYFLLVKDITDFSIRENIYGRIGRGSIGGSLVAYSLGIHNIDPIKFNLLFERFLSESRSSDIVIDYFDNEENRKPRNL